jgi:hypothetical protein
MTVVYSHAFTIAFELISDDARGEDITPQQYADAIISRVEALLANGNEMLEAVGAPYDTYPIEGD